MKNNNRRKIERGAIPWIVILPRPFLNVTKNFHLATLAILFVTSLQLSPAADPPGILNHQGRIAVNGQNHDGPGYFKFSLVKDAGGTESILWHHDGTALGTAEPAGELNLDVSKGHYSVLLGDTAAPFSMTAIPASVFAENDNVSLRIWFSTTSGSGFEQLMPDRRIVSVGYAMVAKTAGVAQMAESVADGAISSAQLADGSVTASKIADGVVATANLEDGSITAAKLAAGLATQWASIGSDISFTTGEVGVSNLQIPDTTATEGIIWLGSDPFLHAFGNSNIFLGVGAGNFSTTGSLNTAVGGDSLNSNTTGSRNTGVGKDSLKFSTTGQFNTAIGNEALRENTVGEYNAATGQGALKYNTEGNRNSAFGYNAMVNNIDGGFNTAMGQAALRDNTSGNYNVGVGHGVFQDKETGDYNIGIGFRAGLDVLAGDHNILIGSQGENGDSRTIRIGSENQNLTFIAGIRGVSPALNDSLPVVIDSNGQLGTAESFVIEQEEWAEATLQGNFVNVGDPYANAGYFKDSFGIVHLEGTVKGDSGPLFVIPAGYRPAKTKRFQSFGISSLFVHPDGQVSATPAGNLSTEMHLDVISFRAVPEL